MVGQKEAELAPSRKRTPMYVLRLFMAALDAATTPLQQPRACSHMWRRRPCVCMKKHRR